MDDYISPLPVVFLVYRVMAAAAREGLVKLLYVVVMEQEKDGAAAEKIDTSSFRYTHSILRSALHLMGCKARHEFKISGRVLEMMRQPEKLLPKCAQVPSLNTKIYPQRETACYVDLAPTEKL